MASKCYCFCDSSFEFDLKICKSQTSHDILPWIFLAWNFGLKFQLEILAWKNQARYFGLKNRPAFQARYLAWKAILACRWIDPIKLLLSSKLFKLYTALTRGLLLNAFPIKLRQHSKWRHLTPLSFSSEHVCRYNQIWWMFSYCLLAFYVNNGWSPFVG